MAANVTHREYAVDVSPWWKLLMWVFGAEDKLTCTIYMSPHTTAVKGSQRVIIIISHGSYTATSIYVGQEMMWGGYSCWNTTRSVNWDCHVNMKVPCPRMNIGGVLITTGAESAGATGDFPRYSLRNRGKHHILARYLSGAYFNFWSESTIITLIAITKCSTFSRINWLIPIISHFKMLDDGTLLFLANYVYTYSLYTRTTVWFSSIGLHLLSIWTMPLYLKPSKSAPMLITLSLSHWEWDHRWTKPLSVMCDTGPTVTFPAYTSTNIYITYILLRNRSISVWTTCTGMHPKSRQAGDEPVTAIIIIIIIM